MNYIFFFSVSNFEDRKSKAYNVFILRELEMGFKIRILNREGTVNDQICRNIRSPIHTKYSKLTEKIIFTRCVDSIQARKTDRVVFLDLSLRFTINENI